MLRDYTVQYSEEDLELASSDFYWMEPNLNPEVCQYVVRKDGIYEISHVIDDRVLNNKWQVYINPILTQCEVNDIICVQSKDKLYKCVSNATIDNRQQQTFRKVTMLSLLNTISDLSDKLHECDKLICSIIDKN